MPNLVLLFTGGGMPETEEEQAKVMEAWGAWYTELGEAVKDGGNPFSGAAKSISSNGTVKDGPVGTMATGYSIIDADSMDSALSMAKGCPILAGGGQITVYETFDVM